MLKALPQNWFLENMLDLEYQSYRLLAYLEKAKKSLDEKKLYPALTQLQQLHKSVTKAYYNKREQPKLFPKSLIGVDKKSMELVYDHLPLTKEASEALNDILGFSINRVGDLLAQAEHLRRMAFQDLPFIEIGIIPSNHVYGYVFIECGEDYKVYRYTLPHTRTRKINFKLFATEPADIDVNEKKVEYFRKENTTIFPAAFELKFGEVYPMKDTVLPIVNQKLERYL